MKRVPNPGNGRKWNKVHGPRMKQDQLISVSENHEEHLEVMYRLRPEIERLKSLPLPASFRVAPGHVKGEELARLRVPGICKMCGCMANTPDGFTCGKHPENPGG